MAVCHGSAQLRFQHVDLSARGQRTSHAGIAFDFDRELLEPALPGSCPEFADDLLRAVDGDVGVNLVVVERMVAVEESDRARRPPSTVG